MARMGLAFGLEDSSGSASSPSVSSASKLCKRKGRWLFKIDGISAQGVPALPPLKTSRPTISFRESEVRHINETIYYPAKPEWKPVQLNLYDLNRSSHPVFEWLRKVYDPQAIGAATSWFPAAGPIASPSDAANTNNSFLKLVSLELYNGCGEVQEKWVFEEAWPQSVEFGELEMGNFDILTCDLTLRFARAYIEKQGVADF